MRLMSFMLTTRQIRERSKTVTRRIGWDMLKVGDVVCAVEKGMGLKRGQKIQRLAMLVVVDVRAEPLEAITADDVISEGFPEASPSEFISHFCRAMRCRPETIVNRIEFRYLPGGRYGDGTNLARGKSGEGV